ncbi:NTP transferase domain-containing protein [candidate division KSB1 bacterium]|nr:NTP transferase domain-containing protein [candidate division KSB1 bacterium]
MIKKAVITAAGRGTRQYPATNAVQKELFPLVDLDGVTKPTIQIIAEQALQAGIEEICIVIQPGESGQFEKHFTGLQEAENSSFTNKPWGLKQSDLLDRLKLSITYVEQTVQEGYGHAVYCAKEWVGDDPFLLLLGDHVYIPEGESSCIQQAILGFEQVNKSVYAVNQTHIEQLYLFGTIAGKRIQDDPPLYEIHKIIEKPDVSVARQELVTEGLPEDTFLTFFGMHVLTPSIFNVLESHIQNNVRSKGEIQLTTAQAELAETEGAVAQIIHGQRLDMGTPLGYIETQIVLARKGAFAHDVESFIQKNGG